MKFIYETSDKWLAELMNSSFFAELVDLLEVETPTLRRLKEVFGNKVEKYLEKLIKKGIIQRVERRYFIGFPMLEVDEELLESWTKIIVNTAEKQKERERIMFLESLFPVEEVEMVYGLERDISLAYYDSLSTENLKVTSLSVEEWPLTLPRYFSNLRTEQIAPIYQDVTKLIGDVDSDYYLDQIQVVVEKILTHRRSIRESIFVKSMRFFGMINKGEVIQLCVPVYTSLELFEELAGFERLPKIVKRMILANVIAELDMATMTSIFLKEKR